MGSLPADDKEPATALEVARGVARRRPEEAAKLIDKAQNSGGSEDSKRQLSAISAQVSVAAAQNKRDELQQLLERGFELAGPMLAESSWPDARLLIPGVASMVQIGVQNYPDMTVNFFSNLPPMRVKAELLMSAAAALQLPGILPIGSASQPSNPLSGPTGKQ